MITNPRRNYNLRWDYKLGQDRLQIGADFRDYKSGQEITNQGKRNYESGQGLQIDAEQHLHSF